MITTGRHTTDGTSNHTEIGTKVVLILETSTKENKMKKSEARKLTEITVPIISEALSKKWYETIAAGIKNSKSLEGLANYLSTEFQFDNRSFDRSRFMKACGFTVKESEVKEASQQTPMVCHECGKKFKKKIGKGTAEVKCPKCGGYDTDVA